MAQGNFKLKARKSGSRVTKKQKNPKKAAPLIIKPKKTAAKETQKIARTQQKQLVQSTERLIASRVGHLELIKGSRKEIESGTKTKK